MCPVDGALAIICALLGGLDMVGAVLDLYLGGGAGGLDFLLCVLINIWTSMYIARIRSSNPSPVQESRNFTPLETLPRYLNVDIKH